MYSLDLFFKDSKVLNMYRMDMHASRIVKYNCCMSQFSIYPGFMMVSSLMNNNDRIRRNLCERHFSASVMNSPLVLRKGRRGICVGLYKGHPPWHIRTKFV